MMSSSESPGSWQSYNEAGKSAFAQGDYAEAEKAWSQALVEAEKFGPEDPRKIRSLLDISKLYHLLGKYQEGEDSLNSALELTEKLVGPDNPRLAVILNNLGAVYSAQGKHWDAEAAYRRALAIAINAYGPFHASVATAFNNIAELCRLQGRFLQAEPMYRYVLAIYEFLDPHSISVANVLHNLALLLCARGRFAEAESVLKKALTLEKPGAGQKTFASMRYGYELLLARKRRKNPLYFITKHFEKA